MSSLPTNLIKSKLPIMGIIWMLVCVGCNTTPELQTLSSPDGQLVVLVAPSPKEGTPQFEVYYKGDTILQNSDLGLVLNYSRLFSRMQLASTTEAMQYKDSYSMFQGKQAQIDYVANDQTYTFENADGLLLKVHFRVSNDGFGFRYVFDNPKGEKQTIHDELTAYHFPESTKMWVQPMSVAKTGWEQCHPSYEEDYQQHIPVNTRSTLGAGWIYPALFKVNKNWVLITEAGLGANYCGTRLEAYDNKLKVEFPSEQEVFTGKGHLPHSDQSWSSPWRVVTVGSLETIISSTLGTDLADPAIDMNTDFVQPGYASWSWAILKDNSVNYETTSQFIDYAAEMGWKYCLIDVDWDQRIGFDKMKELIARGKEKGVGLIVWYNSAGDWNTTPYGPRSKLLTHEDRVAQFSMLQEMGIAGVKIDFFGGDGQSMIAYYHDILRDAADHELLVNFHGATLPRGWHRTYPHLMTVEAIKGFEFITFFQEVADQEATHSAMLPFTRNAYDPMDFTPTCFSGIPDRERKTTNAFELALPTVFQSGIQHIAEIPEGMVQVPDYVEDYLRGLPPQVWDETRLLEGFPGKLVVLARRSGNDWYISGINGEKKTKELNLDLSFVVNATGYMISDGAEHPDFAYQEVSLKDKNYPVSLKPNGGFVMKLTFN